MAGDETKDTGHTSLSRVEQRRTERNRLGWATPLALVLCALALAVTAAFLVNLRGWHEAVGLPAEFGFRKLFLLGLLAGLGAAFLGRRATERIAGLFLLALAWVALLAPYHPFFVGYFEDRTYSDGLLYTAVIAAVGLGALALSRPRAGFLLLIVVLPLRLPVEALGVTVHLMFLTYLLLWCTALGYTWKTRSEEVPRDPLTLPILGLAGVAALSSFWAYNYQEAILRTLYFYGSLPLAYVAARLALRETGTLRLTLAAALVSGLALSGLALYQFKTGYLFYNHPLQSAAFSARNVQLAEGWSLWNASGLTEYRLTKTEGITAGSRIQTMKATGAAHSEIYQYVPVEPGKAYTFSAWGKNSGAGALEIYGLFYRDKGKPSVHDTRRTSLRIEGFSPWRAGTSAITAPEDARYLQVSAKLLAGDSGAEAAVDDIRLSALGSSHNLLRGGGFERAKGGEPPPPVRVNGVFYDPNIFGRYLMLVLLVVLALTIFGTGVFRRTALLAAALLMVSGLLLTYSRSSLMGLVVGLAIILYYRRDLRATLGAVVGLFAVAFFFWSELRMRMPALSAAEGGSDVSGGRVELMLAGLAMWKDSLVWGHGLGSFSGLYPRFATARAPADLSESHNFFITSLGELGILGAAAVLLVIGACAWAILRSGAGKQPLQRGAAAGVLAALVALVVHSSFQAYFFEDPFVWVVLGVAGSAWLASKRDLGQTPRGGWP